MNLYALSAAAAGILWGMIGLFTRRLNALGFDTWSLVAVRCGIAAICFAVLALVRNPAQLRVRAKDAWCFFGAGIMSLLLFTYCYFNAIALMSMSTAGILLYTAPAFVMLMSFLFFREPIGLRGGAALVLCIGGVVLVSGPSGHSISAAGLLYGFGAGFGYALFSIFSRFALNRGYSATAINFYACAIASFGAFCFAGFRTPLQLMSTCSEALLLSLGLGVLICFFPYLLYTHALTGISNGRASIMATVEPVVATLMSVFVFREALSPLSALGILLVLGAIVLMNLAPKSQRTESTPAAQSADES